MDVNGSENLLASRASKYDATDPVGELLICGRFTETAAPASKPVKGASLANPNKKARRYQAVEFDD